MHRTFTPSDLTLFLLVPVNKRAEEVLRHPSNRHLLYILPKGERALKVGFNIRSQSAGTLATLGRNNTDIIIDGPSIARIQCSFEFDPESKLVMLSDRSHLQTTQVYGENATPFEHGRIRQVVVHENLNTIIGLGGAACDLVKFKISWHREMGQRRCEIEKHMSRPHEDNPRLARTAGGPPTTLSVHGIPGVFRQRYGNLKLRHHLLDRMGAGSFGVVRQAIDVDSARFLAVKIIKPWRKTPAADLRSIIEREVRGARILSKCSHVSEAISTLFTERTNADVQPHIVEFIALQEPEGPEPKIFMALKDGNLHDLVNRQDPLPRHVERNVLNHMLQALTFLARNDIVHRDVKPENILYTLPPGGSFRFQLGDFGLTCCVSDAKSPVGTKGFRAPEIHRPGLQTPKADVYSLFVVMV